MLNLLFALLQGPAPVTYEVLCEVLRLLRQRERVLRRRLAALPRSEIADRALRGDNVTLDDLRARRGDILMIAARHGAGNVRVFGSVVRGDAGLGSDVDFLVDMETGRSLMDRSRLAGRTVGVVGLRG